MTGDSSEEARRSRAHAPDLDWSQIRETVLMLELAAGQVAAAMRESSASVEVLADTFTSMAGSLDAIRSALASLNGGADAAGARDAIEANAAELADKVHRAVIAFQFYDKLVQRLDHVEGSLGLLSDLVGDQGRLYNPREWSSLQGQIASKYTMVEERAMFDAVMRGVPVHTALEQYMAVRMQEVEASGGDVELF